MDSASLAPAELAKFRKEREETYIKKVVINNTDTAPATVR
jgi:hypothetical protein